jgi:hypothetical protein
VAREKHVIFLQLRDLMTVLNIRALRAEVYHSS